jgi:sigma-E factor negative regulatory protein RseA
MSAKRNETSTADGPDVGNGDACGRRLSCLLDGELEAGECRELLERLRSDEDACRRWAMFSCVGDALRSSDVASWHVAGFTARVAAAVEREPTVLAPGALPARPRLRRWLVPGAGAAAAAAVLIAIGVPSRQTNSPEAVAALSPPTVPVVSTDGKALQIDRSPLLERYLAAHRELAQPTLMPYSTPYVRTSGALQLQEAR